MAAGKSGVSLVDGWLRMERSCAEDLGEEGRKGGGGGGGGRGIACCLQQYVACTCCAVTCGTAAAGTIGLVGSGVGIPCLSVWWSEKKRAG